MLILDPFFKELPTGPRPQAVDGRAEERVGSGDDLARSFEVLSLAEQNLHRGDAEEECAHDLNDHSDP